MENETLEPISYYKTILQPKFSQVTSDYFDFLIKESGVNESENTEVVKKYYSDVEILNSAVKKKKRLLILKYFLLFFSLIFCIFSILFIYWGVTESIDIPLWICILLAVILIVGLICCLSVIFFKLNKVLKKEGAKINDLNQKTENLKAEAFKQLAPLNNLYDWNILVELFNKSTDLIKLDKRFDSKIFNRFHNQYNLNDNIDVNRSTCVVQSGNIYGNPFVILNDLVHFTGQQTYVGSLTISWEETRTNAEGKTETITRTEVLTASVVKPKPEYVKETVLIYGNNSAPNLSFVREPSGVNQTDSDDQIEKKVKTKEKELMKMVKKSLEGKTENNNFTAMGNIEFDTLFGAYDRSNEVEFRLLFTPLAQKNELSLIKNKEFYGDDFYFQKNKKLNCIKSLHSQSFNYNADPKMFCNFDINVSRKIFNEYYNSYLKNIFFDLSPLLAIPLYQINEAMNDNFYDNYDGICTNYEAETFANSIGQHLFKNERSCTQAILKSSILDTNDNLDIFKISAYSFYGVDRVDYVPVWGRDGRIHNVPVPWIKYIPCELHKNIVIKKTNNSTKDFNQKSVSEQFKLYLEKNAFNKKCAFKSGMFAFVPINMQETDFIELNKVI